MSEGFRFGLCREDSRDSCSGHQLEVWPMMWRIPDSHGVVGFFCHCSFPDAEPSDEANDRGGRRLSGSLADTYASRAFMYSASHCRMASEWSVSQWPIFSSLSAQRFSCSIHSRHRCMSANKLTGVNVCPAFPFPSVVGSLIFSVSLWPRFRAAVAQFGR